MLQLQPSEYFMKQKEKKVFLDNLASQSQSQNCVNL